MTNVAPSLFVVDNRKSTAAITTAGSRSQRRTRNPPTLTSWRASPLFALRLVSLSVRIIGVQVVGGSGTGKTSSLRLLLETAGISPTATIDQQAALDRFLHGSHEAHAVYPDRLRRDLRVSVSTGSCFLSSTPWSRRELKLERQVNGILKYVDAQYAARIVPAHQNQLGDDHLLPPVPDDQSSGDESDDESAAPLTMSLARLLRLSRTVRYVLRCVAMVPTIPTCSQVFEILA